MVITKNDACDDKLSWIECQTCFVCVICNTNFISPISVIFKDCVREENGCAIADKCCKLAVGNSARNGEWPRRIHAAPSPSEE